MSLFGKIVLILLKIFAGILVFGLIMGACALIIGLFAVVIGGPEFIQLGKFADFSLWVPILGIFIVLIPVILMIYVLMCLIASRKPGGKSVLIIFLLWIATIIACSVIAIRENVSGEIRKKKAAVEQIFSSQFIIDGDTTTLKQLLEDYDGESVIEEGRQMLHIAVPSRSIDITVDKDEGEMTVNADGREVSIRAGEEDGEPEVTIREEAASGTEQSAETEPAKEDDR